MVACLSPHHPRPPACRSRATPWQRAWRQRSSTGRRWRSRSCRSHGPTGRMKSKWASRRLCVKTSDIVATRRNQHSLLLLHKSISICVDTCTEGIQRGSTLPLSAWAPRTQPCHWWAPRRTHDGCLTLINLWRSFLGLRSDSGEAISPNTLKLRLRPLLSFLNRLRCQPRDTY